MTPDEPDSLTKELVEELLAPLAPAVKGLGGEMEVVGLNPVKGDVMIR